MIFKNCQLLDIKIGEIILCNIHTLSGKISNIEKIPAITLNGKGDAHEASEENEIRSVAKKEGVGASDEVSVDLEGRIVMPGFANCYLNYKRASVNSFGKEIPRVKLQAKNACAGVCFDYYDLKNVSFLEDLSALSLKELDEISFHLKQDVFVKIGQDLNEMGAINALYKKMPSEVLEDYGILDRRATIVGGNCFEKDELELLSVYNARFVLLPNDDARFGRRFLNVNILNRLNIPFGLGSGEYAEVDFFAFMRELLSFNSFVMENTSLMSAQEALLQATLVGARVLGYDGEIKEGNGANFIVLNGNSLYENIFDEIVFGMSKQNVFMTVKNGKILQQNGVFVMEK